jgi:hypothetical protein
MRVFGTVLTRVSARTERGGRKRFFWKAPSSYYSALLYRAIAWRSM